DAFAGRRIPDFHDPFFAGRSNPLAVVGAERDAADFAAVLEGQDLLTFIPPERGRIPDTDGPIRAGRDQALTIRAERHTRAPAGVSAEAEYLAASRCIPDTHRLVLAARSNALAVWADGDAFDVAGMQKRVQESASRRI